MDCVSHCQTASVDRLPPELLVYVFQLLQFLLGWPRFPDQDTLTLPEAATWIRVTWVSRQWRLTGLE